MPGPDTQVRKNAPQQLFIDLRQFGKAQITRVTLIEWDEKMQAWFIRWHENPNVDRAKWGSSWAVAVFNSAGVLFGKFNGRADMTIPEDKRFASPIYFDDYDDAVKAEVAVIQSLQVRGKLFAPLGISTSQ